MEGADHGRNHRPLADAQRLRGRRRQAFHLHDPTEGRLGGVVRCEVLEVVPHRRLVYSWRGGSDAAPLDSTVTWTLQPEANGTRLRMVHSGFRSPQNDFAYDAMSPGWRHLIGRLGEVVATL